MADYKAIKGHTIQTVAGDPGTLVDGLIWYDNVARKIQGSKTAAGAWASGGNLPGPASTNYGFGTLTAGVSVGGELSGSSNAEAFHYNGTSWTAGGNINTNRNVATGFGTQTAGAIAGGHHPGLQTSVTDIHEQYDGSSWTEAADLNTGRGYLASATLGTTTAALVMGGLINPELSPSPFGAVGEKDESEEWNGTAWSEGDDLNTGRAVSTGAGTQTAALFIAGGDTAVANVESYDGSSWTEIADVNTAVNRSSSGGDQDDAIKASGNSSANVEQWNGTSWTEVANVSTTRGYAAFGFSSGASNGFIAGGTPPSTNATEEWTQETAAVTFTSS